jgi:hypothetical protein
MFILVLFILLVLLFGPGIFLGIIPVGMVAGPMIQTMANLFGYAVGAAIIIGIIVALAVYQSKDDMRRRTRL